MQSITRANTCLAVYRAACAAHAKPADWILRRYAWVGTDKRAIEDDILPRYVGGLMEHWRESAEDEEEKALFARIDSGASVTPQEIAADRLMWGTPYQVIQQIHRYRRETGADHIHMAFGAGLPGDTERSVKPVAAALASSVPRPVPQPQGQMLPPLTPTPMVRAMTPGPRGIGNRPLDQMVMDYLLADLDRRR